MQKTTWTEEFVSITMEWQKKREFIKKGNRIKQAWKDEFMLIW